VEGLKMGEYQSNFTQIPNILFDKIMPELSGSEFKCLNLIIRKTIGWHKKEDAISTRQFLKFTGLKRDRTIQDTINSLVKKGWILAEKKRGKTTRFSLTEKFNQLQNNENVENKTSDKFRNKLLPITGKKVPSFSDISSVGNGGYTKESFTVNKNQNTFSKEACERFIETYPKKVRAKELRNRWVKLDQELRLEEKMDIILEDIRKRLKLDQEWIDRYYPDPFNYLRGERWNDEIQKIRVKNSRVKPDWVSIPRNDEELWEWAKKYDYSNPGQLSFIHYRKKLEREVESRIKN
jgi:phage replication O-like protein O